jgi:hypothetical protein
VIHTITQIKKRKKKKKKSQTRLPSPPYTFYNRHDVGGVSYKWSDQMSGNSPARKERVCEVYLSLTGRPWILGCWDKWAHNFFFFFFFLCIAIARTPMGRDLNSRSSAIEVLKLFRLILVAHNERVARSFTSGKRVLCLTICEKGVNRELWSSIII